MSKLSLDHCTVDADEHARHARRVLSMAGESLPKHVLGQQECSSAESASSGSERFDRVRAVSEEIPYSDEESVVLSGPRRPLAYIPAMKRASHGVEVHSAASVVGNQTGLGRSHGVRSATPDAATPKSCNNVVSGDL